MIDIERLKTQVIIHNMDVQIPHDLNIKLLEKVNNFSQKMCEKDQSMQYYADQRLASNAKRNIETGKYGEIIAAYILFNHGFPKPKIDFEIRHGQSKGWVRDLLFSEVDAKYPDFHVKTCDEITKSYVGDYSWTFQYNNFSEGGGRDILFGANSNDLIAFVYISDMNLGKAALMATAPWLKVKPILSDPISEKLKGLKPCVYYKDLKKQLDFFMRLEDFKPQMRVKYIPYHAFGDNKHEDCELGIVSSVNHKYVFVKFDKQLAKFGWDGTTSQSCLVENLEIL